MPCPAGAGRRCATARGRGELLAHPQLPGLVEVHQVVVHMATTVWVSVTVSALDGRGRHSDALRRRSRSRQVIAVLTGIGVVGKSPALQASVVAPLLGTLAVEKYLVLAVEKAVIVAVAHLYGQLAEAVGGCLTVVDGKHAAAHAVDRQAVHVRTLPAPGYRRGDAVHAARPVSASTSAPWKAPTDRCCHSHGRLRAISEKQYAVILFIFFSISCLQFQINLHNCHI